jgi:hypothetical protein
MLLRQGGLRYSRGEGVQANVQGLKTGLHELAEHTPEEKHVAVEASRWQTHHWTYPVRLVIYQEDTLNYSEDARGKYGRASCTLRDKEKALRLTLHSS